MTAAGTTSALIEVHSYDWSGAGEHSQPQTGIVRCAGPPRAMPVLEAGWSRTRVLVELCKAAERASQEGRFLVGMDFAFSFPLAEKGNQFPDGSMSRANFWARVRDTVWKDGVSGYVARHAAHFLSYDPRTKETKKGIAYKDARRATERAATQARAKPNTVFSLIGGNQVGKGSLCGIALLEELRRHCLKSRLPLAVWPFFVLREDGRETPMTEAAPLEDVPEKCLLLLEIYPSLHWAQAGHAKRRPWDGREVWPEVRNHFGAKPAEIDASSGDEGDALIAWYALSGSRAANGNPLGTAYLEKRPGALAIPWAIIREEGWIYGL
jgi:hypothetical protein